MPLRRLAAIVLLLITVAVAGPAPAAAAPSWSRGPIPVWVERVEVPQGPAQLPVEAGDLDYPLVEWQVRLGERTEQFSHVAQHLTNQAALADASQVSIDIDPASETVVLHQLQLRRGTQVIDQRQHARFSLLRRETSLESGIVDGHLTLNMILHDARVGDVLEYSYTRQIDLAHQGQRYNESFRMGWAAPVRLQRLRLLHSSSRPVYIDDRSVGPPVLRREREGWTEAVWERRDVAAIRNETERPGWYKLYPWIDVSEFRDWAALRDWATPLYEVRQPPSPALKSLIAEVQREPDAARRIEHALRFVQEEIRYTGLEIGPGAWRPSPPATVLARRYGDCKDKTLLLVTLLRATGIDAAPALVNTLRTIGLRQELPRPGVFDHVIARVRVGGRTYWLDGTRVAQGTKLETLAQADYGAALVLASGEQGLAAIPAQRTDAPLIDLTESYDLTAGTQSTAKFIVTTVYRGSEAENMRLRLRSTTISSLTADYLDYYRRRYSGARSGQPVAVRDEPAKNEVSTIEHYLLDHPFASPDSAIGQLDVDAYLMSDNLKQPDMPVRRSPLTLRYPLDIRHHIAMRMPSEWPVNTEKRHIEEAGIDYRYALTYASRTIHAEHRLRTTIDHIDGAGVPKYGDVINRVLDGIILRVTAPDTDEPLSLANVSWWFVSTVMLGALAGAALARTAWRYDAAVLEAPRAGAPVGLGGWLSIVTLGACVTPIVRAKAFEYWCPFAYRELFDAFGTDAATDMSAWQLKGLSLLAIGTDVAIMIVCVAAAALLFQRSRTFPRIYTWLLWAGVAHDVLLLTILTLIDGPSSETSGEIFAATVRDAITAGIWTSYLRVSERVRATFRRARDESTPQPAIAAPAALNPEPSP